MLLKLILLILVQTCLILIRTKFKNIMLYLPLQYSYLLSSYSQRFSLQSKLTILMKFQIIAALFLLTLFIPIQSSCHYSCQNCTQISFTSCQGCPNNSSFTYVLSSSPTTGTCAQLSSVEFNILGVILIIAAVCIIPIFLEEEIVHLFLFLQILGLFYLVQIYYIPILDYSISGCSYLMLFSRISHSYKTANWGQNEDVLKGRIFFGSFSLKSNFAAIGTVNLLIFLMLFLLPLFKNIRKKCVNERVQFCPDWLIDKIVLAAATAFVFLIQQSVSIVYFSLKYDQFSILEVILTILYFLILIVFTINQFFYPLSFFRSKFVQFNVILTKTIIPVFLAAPTTSHFMIFPIVLTFFIVDAIATNKNRHTSKFNRLFAYKIFAILLLLAFTIHYILEIQLNNPQISKGLGYLCFLGTFGIFSFIVMEVIIRVKEVCQLKNQAQTQKSEIKDNTIETIEISKDEGQQKTIFTHGLYLQEPKSQIVPSQNKSIAHSIIPQISDQGLENRRSFHHFESVKIRPSQIKQSQSQIKQTQDQLQDNEKVEVCNFLQSNSQNFSCQKQVTDKPHDQKLESIEIKDNDQKDKRKRMTKRKKDTKSSK